jgi:hypothetical protein
LALLCVQAHAWEHACDCMHARLFVVRCCVSCFWGLGLGANEEILAPPKEQRTVRLSPKSGGRGSDHELDWRTEMKEEIRSAVSEVMQGFRYAPGPTEIDAADVILETESVKDVMKRLEAQHRDNKTAIRLASIQKEGNKQHFMDMVEIQEKLEVATAVMKNPDKMTVDEFHVAKDSVTKAVELVGVRMEMIEKIDKHPLSWPVATEFQKLKRAKPEDDGDDKLFLQAEKKVLTDRRKREDEQKAKSRSSSINRPFRAPQRLSQSDSGYEFYKTELQFY